MSTLAVVHDEQHQRLEVKLRRELGEHVLQLLDDTLTEDILLNPDGSLWVKRMGQGFSRIGEMPGDAANTMGKALFGGGQQQAAPKVSVEDAATFLKKKQRSGAIVDGER